MKELIKKLMPIVDLLLLPLVYPAAWLLKSLRKGKIRRFPRSRNAMFRVGVFPVIDHYYEPQFDHRNPRIEYAKDRNLPGINWNDAGQLAVLDSFIYSDELDNTPTEKPDSLQFFFNNGSFESGDAEYWYQTVRAFKPKRIIEIGSGNSILMAIKAIERNTEEDPGYTCEHTCVEPYEMPWLEQTGVKVVRQKVEELDVSFFASLQKNDILFIDSSHIIRPQGDVLFEFLELLPTLNKGVVVHVHDIFSPKNYIEEWLLDEVYFWNEQYLMEAFLSHNSQWEVLGALNYLRHKHYDRLKDVAPFLTPDRQPGSFYIRKVD